MQSTRLFCTPITANLEDPRSPPAKPDVQLKSDKCGKIGFVQEDSWICNGTTNIPRGSFRGRGRATRGCGIGHGRAQSRQDDLKPLETDASSPLLLSAVTQLPSLSSSQPQQSQQPKQQDSYSTSEITVSEDLMKWRRGNGPTEPNLMREIPGLLT